jgi:hypothetical protein
LAARTGLQRCDPTAHPHPLRERLALRAAHVDGWRTFTQRHCTGYLTPLQPLPE